MDTIGNNNINAKLVLLGDMGAGKSSLVLRFVKGQFLEFQESTIGAAFFLQTLAVSDATVKFEIWDTAGQERYHSLAPMYYRGAEQLLLSSLCMTLRAWSHSRELRSGCRSCSNKQEGYLMPSQLSLQEWFSLTDQLSKHELQLAVLKY